MTIIMTIIVLFYETRGFVGLCQIDRVDIGDISFLLRIFSVRRFLINLSVLYRAHIQMEP